MKTLTINLPDSIDLELVRWELARSLYEKGELTLEEASAMAKLAPTYFKMRLVNPEKGSDEIRQDLIKSAKPFDRKRFDELIERIDVQESWEELVAMIGK